MNCDLALRTRVAERSPHSSPVRAETPGGVAGARQDEDAQLLWWRSWARGASVVESYDGAQGLVVIKIVG